jgi:ferric-dicitrate binding protein FerR (iron transport regulator)
MAELPPNSAPDDPQQSSAPNAWELVCAGILRSGFGRFRSHALDKAMMQLSAEQAWREDRARRMKWWQQIRGAFSHPGFAFAMGTSLLLLIAAGWIFLTTEREQHVTDAAAICRIGEVLDAKWAVGSPQLKNDDVVPSKALRLESGVVELNFASAARVAIQGPVEFRVLGRNSMLLEQGSLSAEVPRQARGFYVKTANATTTDLGTRFGLNAKSDGSSETDVFEGKVRVANRHDTNIWDLTHDMAVLVDANGGTLTAAASQASFPQL